MSGINLQIEDIGIFDGFFIPHLEFIKKQVEECMEENSADVHKEKVLHEIMVQSKAALIEIACKTLIADFQETAMLNEDQKIAYMVYESNLKKKKEQERILKKYPVLKFLLDNRKASIVKLVCEIIERYAKDKNAIRSVLCQNYGMLESISINCGDTHNHGKCVAILDVSGGYKLVYKPRSLAIDLAFEKIVQWLHAQGVLSIKCAKSYDCEQYGWQEYIELKCCNDCSEVIRYCTRLGALLALFRCLGTSDMHAENIIPCGEYPAIIDLETLVTNHNIDTSDGSMFSALKEAYAKSVLGTCFLPNRNSHMSMDIDVSGLGSKNGQKSSKLKYHVVENRGTSEIQIVEKYVETTEKSNSLMLNRKKVNYLDYLKEIQNGFTLTYDAIIRKKSEFQDLLDNCLNKVSFRQVLRGTFIYDKFLKASYHPSYLEEFDERYRILNLLNKSSSEREKAEVTQMAEDDIPYFFSKYNDNHLWHTEGICQENFFLNNTRDEIQNNLNTLGEGDLYNQVRLIIDSFVANKKDINIGGESIKDQFVSKSANEFNIIKDIMDYLIKISIWNHQNDKCVLMDLDLSEEHPFMNVEADGLYSAAGTIIFSFLAAKEIGEDKYIKFSKALLNGYEEIYEINKANISTSVFSGFAVKIYLYFFLYQLTEEACYYKKYTKSLDKLYEYEEYDSESKKDIIGGLAGCIIMMTNIYKIENSDKLGVCIQRFAENLYVYCKEQESFWTGFAHGLSGYALALFKSGKIFHREEYCRQGIQLIQRENCFYIDSLNNWEDLRNNEKNGEWFWCHGAPGILMARMYMLDLTNESSERLIIAENFDASLECFQEHIELNNQSLCHGTLGNVIIAKLLARKFGHTELDKRAEEVYRKAICKIATEGISYGIPGVVGLSSFMLGMSGIGYGLLMHINGQYPNLLGLEMIMR